MGFTRNIFANTLLHIPTQLIAPKSNSQVLYPGHRRRTLDFIFSGSEVTAQTMLRVPITLWPIASRHLTQHKKCDDFLASWCRELFDDISLNDLGAVVFSHNYSLASEEQICDERGKGPFPTQQKVRFRFCYEGSNTQGENFFKNWYNPTFYAVIVWYYQLPQCSI